MTSPTRKTICAGFGFPPVFASFASSAIGRPNQRHYIAFDGDEPVAVAAMAVHDGVAHLSSAATLASHRKRGAQSALIARRIRDAAEIGCRLVTTETGREAVDQRNPSYQNITRAGFKAAYIRPNFIFRA